MINELYNLSKALDSSEITVAEWHSKYNPLRKAGAKAACVRIWLDDDGRVCGLESLSAEHAALLRRYGDNQSSFPALNVNSLYRVTAPAVIAELDRLSFGKSKPDVDEIHRWCISDNWIKGAPGQVRRSMNECSRELVELCGADSRTNVLAALSERCKRAGDGFRASLEKYVFDKLSKQEDIPLMLSLLFHAGTESREHSKDTEKSSRPFWMLITGCNMGTRLPENIQRFSLTPCYWQGAARAGEASRNSRPMLSECHSLIRVK